MLGVLKTGAAYLPIDVHHPDGRIDALLHDAAPHVVLTSVDVPAGMPDDNPGRRVDPGLPAYVIYTSGSTGTPKGVIVGHRSVTALIAATTGRYGFGPDDVWTLFHSPAFDFAVWELWGALLTGGRVVIVGHDQARDPAAFTALLAEQQVTVLNQTPSAFRHLGPLPPTVRLVIFGGEALTYQPDPQPAVEFVNMFGITETTIHTTHTTLHPDTDITIGRPLPNIHVHLLDRHLNPVPAGVTGEMFIAGTGLAHGYLHQPARTAERFIPNPFTSDGSRLYRTGDLARWQPNHHLDYLGRADHQIKIRGHRIEPAEIQTALTTHPAITTAIVTEHNQQLTAYLIGPDGLPPADELRAHLQRTLPEHMIPTHYIELAQLPLTANGKLDRTALPAPDSTRPDLTTTYQPPTTPTEQLLASIWAELLHLDQVGVTDNFFDLGGHSLLATQAIARLGINLPLAALFDHPTIQDLAHTIDTTTNTNVVAPITPADRSQPLPLSYAQQRLWFLAQLDPDSTEYHLPTLIPLPDPVDPAVVARALHTIIERHEILRTRIITDPDGIPHQVIDPPTPLPLAVKDLTDQPDPIAAAKTALLEDARQPFDLTTGPLIRATLLHLTDNRHVLALCLHHIVSDEWSGRILRTELATLNHGTPLPPLPIQYADYATWQRQWLTGHILDTQLQYWRTQLANPPTLHLPTDHPRPPIRSNAGAEVAFTIPEPTATALQQLSRQHGTTMFMTLIAAYATLLHRHTGQSDILIGTPIANRNHPETESLIGFFVNTLALRSRFDDDPLFTELLARTRTTALDAYTHQDLPFEQLVDELTPTRDRSQTPSSKPSSTTPPTPPSRASLRASSPKDRCCSI
ncbi:amino acid adenylation domain-containing protein [Dactylosporangium darangshiense]|uniref:amino acid adenylation domain-containing protein n=1 Tax=Dactylosporangium darangshiense TaxID=579108 RepID=UPI00363294FF